MLEEEAPIVNKDFLLPSCSFGEKSNKIFVSTTIDLGLKEELTQTKEKQCLNLNFVGGFSGAIRDGVQHGKIMVNYIEKVAQKKSC